MSGRRRVTAARTLALGTAALLTVGTGALLWAGPADAQTSTDATGPVTTLGGYNVTSSGAGMSIYYEQPNLPVPATPTLEADVGYTNATFDAGPIGTANASTLWPGSVVASAGTELPLLVGPYLQEYCGSSCNSVPIPDVGNWPVDASTSYPQGPDADNEDSGPSTMEAGSTDAASTATASLSTIGGTGTAAVSGGLVTAQGVAATAQSTIGDTGDALAQATSAVQNISIAGGLIDIGQVTSTATSSSDGNQATVDGSSAATGVTVAGQAVSVGSGGVTESAIGSQNLLGAVLPDAETILQTAGITMTMTNPTDTVNGPSGERELDGLEVTINLSTYDKNFSSLIAMMPTQLRSAIYQLPAPLPDEQIVTLDFGWVNVSANASPAFDASLPNDATGSFGPSSASLGATPGAAGSSPGTFGGTTPTGAGGTATTAAPAGDGGGTTVPLATAPAALFKGIGAGLIALGLLLGALLAFFLIGTEAMVAGEGAAVGCFEEDLTRFGAAQ